MNFHYDDFFETTPPREFQFLMPFSPPWTIPQRISKYVGNRLNALKDVPEIYNDSPFLTIGTTGKEPELTVVRSFVTEAPLFVKKLNIYIDSNTSLECGATIKSNVIIGKECEVRHSAYIRGNVILGDRCVVGHASEVKNSVMLYHVESGHFNYVGDSLIGSFVNLGAGTILSNLNFRSLEQKKNNQFPTVNVYDKDGKRHVGSEKFGCVIGDGTETGCNSVIAPGTCIGKCGVVYPCVFVQRKYYAPHSIIK